MRKLIKICVVLGLGAVGLYVAAQIGPMPELTAAGGSGLGFVPAALLTDRGEMTMTESQRWAQLDRAQFAMDQLHKEKLALIERARTATTAEEQEHVRAEWIALAEREKVVGESILAGSPAPHLRAV
jgi:hypothetical protein